MFVLDTLTVSEVTTLLAMARNARRRWARHKVESMACGSDQCIIDAYADWENEAQSIADSILAAF